jgi:hypothetical protein
MGVDKKRARVGIWAQDLEAAWEKTADGELYSSSAKGEIAATAGIVIGRLSEHRLRVCDVIEVDHGPKDNQKVRAVQGNREHWFVKSEFNVVLRFCGFAVGQLICNGVRVMLGQRNYRFRCRRI